MCNSIECLQARICTASTETELVSLLKDALELFNRLPADAEIKKSVAVILVEAAQKLKDLG